MYKEMLPEEQKGSFTYLPSLSEAKKIAFITKELDNIEYSTKDIRDKIQKARQNYRCEYTNKFTKTNREKVFMPLTREFVNSVAPKLKIVKESLIAHPTEEGDVIKARLWEFLLRFQGSKMGFFDKVNLEGKRNMALDGTVVAKISWDYETRKDGKKTVVVKDEPNITFIDLLDCYVDPVAESIQQAPFFAVRYESTVEDLKDNPLYKNTQYVRGYNTEKVSEYDSTSTKDFDSGASTPTSEIERVDIWECWTNDRVITIANRDAPVIIRDQKNPYKHGKKPFEECWYLKTGRRWYGMGIGEMLLDMQRMLNQWTNQRIENRELLLNKMFLVKRGQIRNAEQLLSRPAGFIEVDDLNFIRDLQFQDITVKSFEEEQNIYTWAQRITNAWEAQAGGASTSGTATEATIKSRGTDLYFSDVATTMKGFISRVFQQVAQLDMQFLDQETTIRIMGDNQDFIDIDDKMGIPNDKRAQLGKYRFININDIGLLQGMFDFEIDLDSSQVSDRAVRVKQLNELLMTAGADPELAGALNKVELYKEILAMEGLNPDKFFNKEQPQKQGQLAELEQAVQKAGGLPPGIPNEGAMAGAANTIPQQRI